VAWAGIMAKIGDKSGVRQKRKYQRGKASMSVLFGVFSLFCRSTG